jgi:hypothetical protein
MAVPLEQQQWLINELIGIRTRFSDEALTVRELDIGRAVFLPCRGNPWPAIPAFVVSEVECPQ